VKYYYFSHHTGTGKSKKAAKRKAAYQMLQRINQGANISREDMEPEDFDEDALSLVRNLYFKFVISRSFPYLYCACWSLQIRHNRFYQSSPNLSVNPFTASSIQVHRPFDYMLSTPFVIHGVRKEYKLGTKIIFLGVIDTPPPEVFSAT
jgi:hypothetical protein